MKQLHCDRVLQRPVAAVMWPTDVFIKNDCLITDADRKRISPGAEYHMLGCKVRCSNVILLYIMYIVVCLMMYFLAAASSGKNITNEQHTTTTQHISPCACNVA